MANPTPKARAAKLLAILEADRDNHLLRIDDYVRGIQDDPYMPEKASDEYKLLAKRAITNVMPFIIATVTQAMYVDSFRRGSTSADAVKGAKFIDAKTAAVQPEWDHWQKSGLDARQGAIYAGAAGFGHSFVLTEKTKRGVISKGLSALKTAAIFEDPANDLDPLWALTVTSWPTKEAAGKARMFDATTEYAVTFKSMSDPKTMTVNKVKAHGAKENPITRFAASVDLEGRTVGVVEPMIPLQNRINQTVFDLLIVQSFASFKVRTVSGMLPPVKMKPIYQDVEGVQEIVDWEPEIDPDTGKPIPENIDVSAARFLFAEDEDTKFGTLDETPLDGFIKAIEMGFRQMAALSQSPPHHILGEIANLSAEALQAAETALMRRVAAFQSQFGEAWERVFRIAAQLGDHAGDDDFSGEVIWRDMEQSSLAQSGDALGKFAESLGIPKRGLWHRVPNVTAQEISQWEDLKEEEDAALALSNAARAASVARSQRPDFRQPEQSSQPAVVNPIDASNAA